LTRFAVEIVTKRFMVVASTTVSYFGISWFKSRWVVELLRYSNTFLLFWFACLCMVKWCVS